MLGGTFHTWEEAGIKGLYRQMGLMSLSSRLFFCGTVCSKCCFTGLKHDLLHRFIYLFIYLYRTALWNNLFQLLTQHLIRGCHFVHTKVTDINAPSCLIHLILNLNKTLMLCSCLTCLNNWTQADCPLLE